MKDAVYQISGLSLKNCDRELPDIQTYIHTYRGPKQGKPGRNQNSSQGSVLVSGHYWFVKQSWLVYITSLYRVSEKYGFLPQRFNRLPGYENPGVEKKFGIISHRKKVGFPNQADRGQKSKMAAMGGSYVGFLRNFLIWTQNRHRS